MTSIFYKEFLSPTKKKEKKLVKSTDYVSLAGLYSLKDNTPTVVANCDFTDGSIGLTWKQFPNTSWEEFQASPDNFWKISDLILQTRRMTGRTVKTQVGMIFYWLTNCEQILLLAKMLNSPLKSKQEKGILDDLIGRGVEVALLPD